MISTRLPLRTTVLAATLTVSAILLSACSGSGETKNDDPSSGANGMTVVPVGHRPPIGNLKGETIDGKELNVADYRGRIVVINVWGSWCSPCRAEAPDFAKVAKSTKRDGVAFVGINTRDNSRLARAFTKDFNIDYPSLYDPYGEITLKGFPKGTINPQAIPSTVVLDRQGRIAARALEQLTGDDLRKMILLVKKK
ncbi:TlpA disulfide reductase family protein [Streptomyces murinus]|uniref:TlpA family protein disulfide reductase n=1 Tax=Streptomyces murinus TaxID=33900 RepID=UPI002E0D4D61|nr:TlpA family protein disulfide reductase [Streptomyces murinus]